MHKDFLEYEAILKRVSYKPNARFEIECLQDVFGDFEWYIFVRMLMDVPDVNTGKMTTIRSGTQFRAEMSDNIGMTKEDFFVKMILGKLIAQLERHEQDEWFKLDGKFVNDPHPQPKVYAYD